MNDQNWENEMLYFKMNMLQMECAMQGMIAENNYLMSRGEKACYRRENFDALVKEFGVHHNNFPFYKG